MLERLDEIVRRHAALAEQQADPEVAVDPKRSREVAQKLAELELRVVNEGGKDTTPGAAVVVLDG